jgi:iron complex transport system substrate-binding protein
VHPTLELALRARVADIMRIVSLACSNTEIVHALGCAAMLVGVDDHSDWPEEVVAPLPRLGPDLDIDVDAVRALRPDLVLATLTVPGHEKVVARLESAGLPFVAPEPVSLGDVYSDIRDIGALLGVPERAAAVVAEMRAELDAPPPPEDAPRILVQWWPKPVIAPGRLSWTTDVLHAAGARSILEDENVKSRPMSDEEVAERAPDAVVLSWCGVHPSKYRPDVVLRNPAWTDLAFVRERRVHCVGEPFLGRPGPRLVEGARALRSVVSSLT